MEAAIAIRPSIKFKVSNFLMNTLPTAISQVLENCRQCIDQRGDLSSIDRKKIYEKIDELSAGEHNNAGYYRRVKLELICAWKVLDKWEYQLTDNSARELLELAEKSLKGEVESQELQDKTNHLYIQAEDLMDKGEQYFMAAYAGFACISAANAVLYDIDLDIIGIPEIEIDPDDWTACFYACAAYCGGATWEEAVGDDLKRREFWEWFLNEAIPAIWQ